MGPRAHRDLYARLLDLFPPWERQQLADAHCFVFGALQEAFMMCVCGGRDGECPIDPSAPAIRAAACDVGAIRRRLATDPELGLSGTPASPAQIAHSRAAWRPPQKWWVVPEYDVLIGGPLPCSSRWDCVPPAMRHLRDALYQSEDAAPPLAFAGDGAHRGRDGENDPSSPPPFAWVDGHDGLDCRRWGLQLPRKVPSPPGPPGHVAASQGGGTALALGRWRWLGFAFYDRARVELLKAAMPAYSTGWLSRPRPSDQAFGLGEELGR